MKNTIIGRSQEISVLDSIYNSEDIREVSALGQAFVKGIFHHATVMYTAFGLLMQI